MRWIARLYLIGVAIIGWSASILQVGLVVHIFVRVGLPARSGLIDGLSYFTVMTNILVAIVATAAAIHGKSDMFLTRPSLMCAAAVYIIIVGVIYSLFLRPLWSPVGLQLVADVALHGVTPIVYPVFWLVFVPKGKVKWIQPVYWLVYPVLYVGYSLLRGLVSNRYLYPFADVTMLGYRRVFINTGILLFTFLVLGFVMVAIDRVMARVGITRRVEMKS